MADAGLVAAITDMGFSEPAAQRGLTQTGGDLERAIEWIMMHMDDPNLNDPLPPPGDPPPPPGAALGLDDDDGDLLLDGGDELLDGFEEEELVIRVEGCEKAGCNGDFFYSGERNDRPCFTNARGAGALYYDGTFWKVCQIGEGPSESGWNYSQNPPADGPAARLPPIGSWTKEQANQGEAPVGYDSVRLECLSAEEAAASPAPDPEGGGPPGGLGAAGERRPADFASWLAERGRPPQQRAARRVTLAADDDPSVQMIMAMGFTMNAAKKSLHFCRNDIGASFSCHFLSFLSHVSHFLTFLSFFTERAMEWIMTHMDDPTLNEEFDPNYDPATALIAAIDSMAPNLEERLEALNTEVLMQTGEPGSGMENPESQMKIASALIKMLQRPHATDDPRIPQLRECVHLLLCSIIVASFFFFFATLCFDVHSSSLQVGVPHAHELLEGQSED